MESKIGGGGSDMQKMMEQLSSLQSQTEMMGKAAEGFGGNLKNLNKKAQAAGMGGDSDSDDNQLLDKGKFMIDTTKNQNSQKKRR